jgi:hypothetical protein
MDLSYQRRATDPVPTATSMTCTRRSRYSRAGAGPDNGVSDVAEGLARERQHADIWRAGKPMAQNLVRGWLGGLEPAGQSFPERLPRTSMVQMARWTVSAARPTVRRSALPGRPRPRSATPGRLPAAAPDLRRRPHPRTRGAERDDIAGKGRFCVILRGYPQNRPGRHPRCAMAGHGGLSGAR